VLGGDIEPSSDDVVSTIPTLLEPELVDAELEIGVDVHIDDCLCMYCEESRGIIEIGTTILVEVSNEFDTMVLRLLPTEAMQLAKALIKHTADLEDLHEQGVWEHL
jgi:hypothetical protein|tara:strand:+ start:2015 stop:2332 length:318 start_codon:yes stop_codon:yes gene_type:complete